MWCLEDDVSPAGEALKTLMITLVRPSPTESENTWKKGDQATAPYPARRSKSLCHQQRADPQHWCSLRGSTLSSSVARFHVHAFLPFPHQSYMHAPGKRQNNQTKERPGSLLRKGFRFFADDEDEFDLEDLLQALCFLETGSTWGPSKPWQPDVSGNWVEEARQLPEPVQQQLKHLLELQQCSVDD